MDVVPLIYKQVLEINIIRAPREITLLACELYRGYHGRAPLLQVLRLLKQGQRMNADGQRNGTTPDEEGDRVTLSP